MVLLPTLRDIGDVAEPDVAAEPLTVMLAFAWFRVGVTVTELTPFATDAVYEVVAESKDGERVAVVTTRAESVASFEPVPVLEIVITYVLTVPSCAVTFTFKVLDPTAIAKVPEAVPELTETYGLLPILA